MVTIKKFLIISLFLLIIIPNAASASSGTVMILGDSLSTNYGMPVEAGWVNLLKLRLQTHESTYQVINISITGETTFGGRHRIEQALETHHPDIVILGLGGNDALQGSSINAIYDNLQAIITACQQNNVTVLLLGMQIPPNYGIRYTQKFRDIYTKLANNNQIALVPFLLAGFGEKRDFFQSDGIHPNIQAQEKIVENVWPIFYPMLDTK
jgi:acyl-CoA thioesterase-1